MSIQDIIAQVSFLLFAIIAGPISIRQGRAFLAGRYPKRGSYAYNRSVLLISIFNVLAGVPPQAEPYEWQWHLLGRYIRVSGILFLAWIPIGLFLLLRG